MSAGTQVAGGSWACLRTRRNTFWSTKDWKPALQARKWYVCAAAKGSAHRTKSKQQKTSNYNLESLPREDSLKRVPSLWNLRLSTSAREVDRRV